MREKRKVQKRDREIVTWRKTYREREREGEREKRKTEWQNMKILLPDNQKPKIGAIL